MPLFFCRAMQRATELAISKPAKKIVAKIIPPFEMAHQQLKYALCGLLNIWFISAISSFHLPPFYSMQQILLAITFRLNNDRHKSPSIFRFAMLFAKYRIVNNHKHSGNLATMSTISVFYGEYLKKRLTKCIKLLVKSIFYANEDSFTISWHISTALILIHLKSLPDFVAHYKYVIRRFE